MKVINRLIITFYLIFLTYSVVLSIYGPVGVSKIHKLNDYKNDLVNNITELSKINQDLSKNFQNIYKNSEIITLEARKLGYLKENEGFIKINNTNIENKFYSVGKIINFNSVSILNSRISFMISIIFGSVFFILFTIFDKKRE